MIIAQGCQKASAVESLMRLRRWLFRLALSAPVLLTNADRGAKLKWMSLARRLRRLVLAAAAFGTAAGCAGRPAEQPAAAKASGQEKAVRLTLRLHKRDIRVGEPLRVQFVLTNVGPEKIPVLDDLYRHPEALDHNLSERWGTYVEVQGPEGDALGSWILLHASPANEAHFCDGPSRGPSYNPWKPGDERAIQLGPGESPPLSCPRRARRLRRRGASIGIRALRRGPDAATRATGAGEAVAEAVGSSPVPPPRYGRLLR